MMAHFAWAGASGDAELTPFHLFEVLIYGGWPVPVVSGALDTAFSDPETGGGAIAQFARAVCSDLIYCGRGTGGLVWSALCRRRHARGGGGLA